MLKGTNYRERLEVFISQIRRYENYFHSIDCFELAPFSKIK